MSANICFAFNILIAEGFVVLHYVIIRGSVQLTNKNQSKLFHIIDIGFRIYSIHEVSVQFRMK